jgi:ATP-binding cassette subfamily F protein uup
MPPPPSLLLQDISLTFGTTPLLSGAELAVSPGDRTCLVGRNGSGKSTLLRIAAGLVQADAGSRFTQPGATIRYLPQEPDLAEFATTFAYVEAGLGSEADEDRHRARYLLEQLGLTGTESPHTLSGGEARRAALARVLAPSPDILLLDEPTNHLDLPGIEWLERELAGLRSGIVVISHDRRLLERISRATVWLDRGITRRLERGFAGFEGWRDAVLEQEETEHHKLGRKIAMEEDWLRYGVTARRKRNQKRCMHCARGGGNGAPPQALCSCRPPKASCPAAWLSRRMRLRSHMVIVRSCGISPPASCVETVSASSAPTVPARRRCSIC